MPRHPRIRRSVCRFFGARAVLCVTLLTFAATASAQDWPTYMHDNARSGLTSAELKLPLVEMWTYRSAIEPRAAWPAPQPGWTELPKVDFDNAFYTVADKETVYFGSSVDYKLHALDLAAGSERWTYTTSGPIRLAPALAGGRVYFGSDDGQVYCLDANSGQQLWSFTAARDARRVLGNGHVTSLWPVRTGVLVEGDRVYSGAGIFPYHGLSMQALDAASGSVVWKNDKLTNYGGFSPQGYLLSQGNRLVVPSGRASPLVLNRESGEAVYEVPHSGDKGAATGTYGVIVDDRLFVGTQNTLLGNKVEGGEPAGRWLNTMQLLATPESIFLLQGPAAPRYGRGSIAGVKNDVTCLDRQKYQDLPSKTPDAIKSAVRWKFARPDSAAMIAAGNHLVVGGQDEVVVVDSATGQIVWEGKVDGLAVGLMVAHGTLVVSTTKGSIHTFANGAAPSKSPAVPPTEVANAKSTVDSGPSMPLAREVVKHSSVQQGYALLTGSDAVKYAPALAAATKLHITCVETNPAELDESRALVGASLYGSRITVELGTPDGLPFPDYAANLLLHVGGAGDTPSPPAEILRVLKPCGGVFLTNAPNSAAQGSPLTEENWRALKEPDARIDNVEFNGLEWRMLKRGQLAGSGWWTHQYGDAGGSGSSGDQLVKGQLDVLWFGEPGADEFPDRHQRGPAPLVFHGRVFCQGWNFLKKEVNLFCFDQYNGVRYWKQPVEGEIRLRLPALPGNLACDSKSAFIAAGHRCYRFDAMTGERLNLYETPSNPDGTRPEWSYLSVTGNVVIGSASVATAEPFSDLLFALDVDSGQPLWTIRAKQIRDTTLAVSEGRLLYVEDRNPPPPKPETPKRKSEQLIDAPPPGPVMRHVVAIDARSGKSVWEKAVDLTDCGRWDQSMWGSMQSVCDQAVLVLAGAYTIYPSRAPQRPHMAVALSTRDGSVLWSRELGNRTRPVIMQGHLLAEPVFHNLLTGEPILKPRGNTGKLIPWSSGPRTGGCGSLSASECMLFGRGGYTVWRDTDKGTGSAFVGTRPGCLINIIPAGGVVVQAEASSGCACYQAIQSTVVFKPRSQGPTTD